MLQPTPILLTRDQPNIRVCDSVSFGNIPLRNVMRGEFPNLKNLGLGKLGERVLFAALIPHLPTEYILRVLHLLDTRSEFEVIGVIVRWHPIFVIDRQTIGDRAIEMNPDEAVGWDAIINAVLTNNDSEVRFSASTAALPSSSRNLLYASFWPARQAMNFAVSHLLPISNNPYLSVWRDFKVAAINGGAQNLFCFGCHRPGVYH